MPLSAFRSVSLGGPAWCARAAAFDLPALRQPFDPRRPRACSEAARAAETAERGGVAVSGERRVGGSLAAPPGATNPSSSNPCPAAAACGMRAYDDSEPSNDAAAHAWLHDVDAASPVPPAWHLLTLHTREGPPLFLCAPSEAQAIAWAAGLAPLLQAHPAPTFASCLWRRVRLRLDDIATRSAGAEGRADTRLGVLAAMLREMGSNEESRRAWVRYHLSIGDKQSAKMMGWQGSPVGAEDKGTATAGSGLGPGEHAEDKGGAAHTAASRQLREAQQQQQQQPMLH
jgi:hypothetical protein